MLIETQSVDLFREYLQIPDIHILLITNVSESINDFRKEIRREIYEYFDQALENGELPNINYESQVQYDFKEILDLSKVPHPQWGGLSISHCPSQGIFVSSSQCKNLGVDIEEISRISREVLLRTCLEEEVDSAPSLAHLWTAKEAAFKSFYRLSPPQTLSQIKIFDWNEKKNKAYHFRYKLNDSNDLDIFGEGLSLSLQCLNLSICKI